MQSLLALQQQQVFETSPYVPLAVGFFGLGTGYLIWSPQEIFGIPPRDEKVDLDTGIWGIWMPGFMQFITGVYLWIGLTWFQVFNAPDLYMAALAFTAYGVHWFAIGFNRYRGADERPNGFMAVPFTLISVLGIVVFFGVGLWAVGILFVGLTGVYVTDIFSSLRIARPLSLQLHGIAHLATGVWLMYLVWGVVLNIVLGTSLPAPG